MYNLSLHGLDHIIPILILTNSISLDFLVTLFFDPITLTNYNQELLNVYFWVILLNPKVTSVLTPSLTKYKFPKMLYSMKLVFIFIIYWIPTLLNLIHPTLQFGFQLYYPLIMPFLLNLLRYLNLFYTLLYF